MTQEQALVICRKLMPDAELQLERVHCIGAKRGYMEKFQVWDWSLSGTRIIATSELSWEHCVAIVKTHIESAWEHDSSPVEPEAA